VCSSDPVGDVDSFRRAAHSLKTKSKNFGAPELAGPGEVADPGWGVTRLAVQVGARLATLEAEESLLTELFDSLTEGAIAVDSTRQVMRINDVGRVLADCAAAGCGVEDLEVGRADLEDVFLQLVADQPCAATSAGARA